MLDVLTVLGVGFLSGRFAVPVGFALDVDAVTTYVAATLGSMAGMALFLWSGDRLRWLVAAGREQPGTPESAKLRSLRSKGPRWLGLIGPTFPGVTVSVVVGITAGMDRGALGRWMSLGIAGLYAVYVAGLSLLVS